MRISDWSSDVCSSDLHTCDNMFKVVGGALYDGDTDPDVSAWDGPCFDDRIVGGYSLQAEQALGNGMTFTSITAYRDRTTAFRTDRDFTALPVLTTGLDQDDHHFRSDEHTSELQSLMRISYA